ncbi:uncharacterized protein LOC113238980, partial [Hyposmocoma kahamanoa]|uniref:uncharacterized protein LOC113238980 n=1 Tax=Hyposmocoma kahamanoa TaxID=1477025 RepID=UPI000E6D5C41
IGANASFGYILDQRLSLVINAILPKPNVDVHTLYVIGSLGDKENPINSLEAEYRTDVTKIVTGVKGKLQLLADTFDTNSTITWTSASGYKNVENLVLYKWDVNGSHFVDYTLKSPLYLNDDTFKLKGSYQKDMVHHYQIVKGLMHRPGKSQIGELDIRYGGFKHTDGHFNMTTPFQRLPWLKSIFDINNQDQSSDNKVDIFWPNKTVSINTTHHYKKEGPGFTQNGVVSISLPLNTQHLVHTQYYYIQGDKWSNGNTTIEFDGEQFVKGSFKQILRTSDRNLELATTDIEVENEHTPVGIKYIHEYDSTGNIEVKGT